MTRISSHVIDDPKLTVNGVDISTAVREVEVKRAFADVEDTSSGDDNEHSAQGLGSGSFDATLRQSFDASSVDDVLEPLFMNGTDFTVLVSPTSDAVSDTNPSWTATCCLREYSPLAGKMGDLAEVKISFKAQSKITKVIT
jgi:hypothetical protein